MEELIRDIILELASLDPCEDEDEACTFVKLSKQDPIKIAKRLNKFVDKRRINSDEDDLLDADEFWNEHEGLAYDTHFEFRHKITDIALKMRLDPETDMIPVLTQHYFNWLKRHNLKGVKSDMYLYFCIEDCGIHLHQKTADRLARNIRAIYRKSETIPAARNTKKIERQIREFILENPRQRSITGTKRIKSGTLGDLFSR